MTLIKCDLPGCEVEFEQKSAQHRYCTTQHKNKHLRQRNQATLKGLKDNNAAPLPSAVEKDDDDDQPSPVKRERMALKGADIGTQYIFQTQENEIDRWKSAYEEERKKKKKLRTENESLRTELAGIKTDNKIREIQDEKPGGLSGLMENPMIEKLLDHLGPHIGALFGKMAGTAVAGLPAGEGGGDPQAQQLVNEMLGWAQQQPPAVQMKFMEMINMLDKIQPEQVLEKLTRIVGLLGQGVSVSKATGTHGY